MRCRRLPAGPLGARPRASRRKQWPLGGRLEREREIFIINKRRVWVYIIFIRCGCLRWIRSSDQNALTKSIFRRFLYFVALMIVSLIERNIRNKMEKEKIQKLPILPQGMNTKKPTWNNIRYFFRNIHLALILKDKIPIQVGVQGFGKLHIKPRFCI